jgi:hypothetical protein
VGFGAAGRLGAGVRHQRAAFAPRKPICRRLPPTRSTALRRPSETPPASERGSQKAGCATHRPPSSAPSGGGTSSSAGKGAVVRPQQQSASVVDLLPKTALVQAARRLADVPSHAMLIFKQQPCSRREVEEEAKKDKSSQVTQGLARVGLAPSFAPACRLRSNHRVRKDDFGLSPRAPRRAKSATVDLEKKRRKTRVFPPARSPRRGEKSGRFFLENLSTSRRAFERGTEQPDPTSPRPRLKESYSVWFRAPRWRSEPNGYDLQGPITGFLIDKKRRFSL